jgi:hypothetical protein
MLLLLFFLFFSFFGTGVQGLLLETLHQRFFVMDFFKIGCQELFAWAGFKPRSS